MGYLLRTRRLEGEGKGKGRVYKPFAGIEISNKGQFSPTGGIWNGMALSRGRVFRGFEPGTLDHGTKKGRGESSLSKLCEDTPFGDLASIST